MTNLMLKKCSGCGTDVTIEMECKLQFCKDCWNKLCKEKAVIDLELNG